jgi:hypothetical protein
MRTLIAVLAVALLLGCVSAGRPAALPVPDPTPVSQVRTWLRLSGVSEQAAGAPMAVLDVAGPDGAVLVVAQHGRWWALPDGRVKPADEYAERLAEELFLPTR